MNLPNKITCLRILLMPFTFYLIYQETWYLFLIGYIMATLIGFSDILDGYLARRYGIETRFGRFLDPLADKIFVVTLLLYFIDFQLIPAWLVILVMIREFAMTDIRILAVGENSDIRVNLLGKRKALFQYLLLFQLGLLRFLELRDIRLDAFSKAFVHGTLYLLMALVAVFTAMSMFYYLWLNRKTLFEPQKNTVPAP
jgi:CDP-diacylglycerol--glycerol-3-phosphate 3-phosphatidyltransferase